MGLDVQKQDNKRLRRQLTILKQQLRDQKHLSEDLQEEFNNKIRQQQKITNEILNIIRKEGNAKQNRFNDKFNKQKTVTNEIIDILRRQNTDLKNAVSEQTSVEKDSYNSLATKFIEHQNKANAQWQSIINQRNYDAAKYTKLERIYNNLKRSANESKKELRNIQSKYKDLQQSAEVQHKSDIANYNSLEAKLNEQTAAPESELQIIPENNKITDFNFQFSGMISNVKMTNSDFNKLSKKYKTVAFKNGTVDLIDYSRRIIKKIKKNREKFHQLLHNDDFQLFKSDIYNKFYKQNDGFEAEIEVQKEIENEFKKLNLKNYESHFKIISDIDIPFRYSQKSQESSNQIDLILICRWGIFAIEVKYYKADQIDLLTDKKNPLIKSYNPIGDKEVQIPNDYISTIQKGNPQLHNGYNNISRQTYQHKLAIIYNIRNSFQNGNKFKFNREVIEEKMLGNIVHSPLIYRDDIANHHDDYYQDKADYQDESVHKNWRVEAAPMNGCLKWIIDNYDNNETIKKLTPDEIDRLGELFRELQINEKKYNHDILGPQPENNRMSGYLASMNQYLQFLNRLDAWVESVISD